MNEGLIGRTLGRYKILNRLGEGGMGAVYKAYDITLHRDVAVKIMHAQYAEQEDFKERFLQEARLAAHLHHPGIVQVHDFSQSDSIYYIVMDFIPGPNLAQMLRDLKSQRKWIRLDEAIEIIQQVADALDYAHHNGVFHRDVKPANIMIIKPAVEGKPYQTVLTDLGLAKSVHGGLVTQTNTTMGTPAYMSPEQALGKTVDARSDVYSLGILLFELATGSLPFQINSLPDAIHFHTQVAPPTPRSIRPDLPEALDRVILKAMEKEPAKRFQSTADLAKALEQFRSLINQTAASPAALENTVSLITQLDEAPKEARGPSIFQEIGLPPDRTKDRIQVKTGDNTPYAVTVKAGSMTIGRDPDNDIVLQDTSASRHHARITVSGSTYSIVDLNATNGTFLANARLIPGIPQQWNPDQAVRIGSSWLRLAIAEKNPPKGGVTTPYPVSGIASGAGAGAVAIQMDNAQVAVEPGSSASLRLTVHNQGTLVDQFQITVEGVPADWVTYSTRLLPLMDGAQGEVVITFQPPRRPDSRAGRHSFTVRAASRSYPNQAATAKGALTVNAYRQYRASLEPEKIRSEKTSKVAIFNEGNTQEVFSLTFKDRADEVAFTPPQAQLPVGAGQAVSVAYQAKPRQKRLLGGEQIHPFTVEISEPAADPQVRNGELVSKALIPRQVIALLSALFGLCVLLGAAAAVVLPIILKPSPTPTLPIPTEVAATGVAVVTSAATLAPSLTPTDTQPPTPTPTGTLQPSPTSTVTPTATNTATITPTATTEPTRTFTPTPSPGSFAGTWEKSKPAAGDISRVVIKVEGNDITVSAIRQESGFVRDLGTQPGQFEDGKIIVKNLFMGDSVRRMNLTISKANPDKNPVRGPGGGVQVFFKGIDVASEICVIERTGTSCQAPQTTTLIDIPEVEP